MNNFAKPGYSVNETAQLIGVTPATIRHWIDNGALGAYVSSDRIEKGHKRKIRIGREHIADYIYDHPMQFGEELKKTFSEYRTGYPKPDNRDDICEEDTPAPTGAWADLIRNASDITTRYQEQISAIKTPTESTEEAPKKSYILYVNGRVAVGNISAETAQKIAGALLADDICDIESIEIRKLGGENE